MMKSCFIKEQKRYSLNSLSSILNIEEESLIRVLKKLRQYGILKIVKNNNEELDRSDLLVDEDIITEVNSDADNLYIFNFVGVFIASNIVFKCYPKYIQSENYHNHLKKIISVLEKYNSENQIVPILNDLEIESSYNLLAIMVYLIKDYIEYGPYQKEETIYEVNGTGNINWDKTINETFTLIKNDRPFYPELITRKNQLDQYDYFKRLHQSIVTQCSKTMEEAGLIDLFSIIPINESEEEISDFGEIDHILYEIEKEMNVQFNTRRQFLLKLIYAYLSEKGSFETSDSVYIYGTSNFKKVWEVICQKTFDNDLNTILGNLRLPCNLDKKYNGKEDTLLSIIEKPCWNFENEEKKTTDFFYAKGTFIPDCIKIDSNYTFNIYDTKYYVPRITEKSTITSQPGIEDVSKQFLYQMIFKDFVNLHGIKNIRNYFLMPSEEKQTKKVCVSMNLFNDIGLENIEVLFLKADNIYDIYLEGKIIYDNLGE